MIFRGVGVVFKAVAKDPTARPPHAWTNATSFCAAAALVRPRYAAIGIFFAMTATNRRLMSSWPGKSRPCHVWQTVSHMCEYLRVAQCLDRRDPRRL